MFRAKHYNTFMFKIKIVCLGKFKEKAFIDLEKEYLKRLKPFAKFEVIELPEVPYREKDDIDRVKLLEAEAIEKRLGKDSIVILLEEKGQLRNSKDFATFLDRIGNLGQEVIFVIGSGVGLHDSLRGRSNYSISLSPLTFPHNFARVLLEEQIYRACTILSGKAYHK
jgi:23S rRNA (pseudouridine1915-N3)-methyltransferase